MKKYLSHNQFENLFNRSWTQADLETLLSSLVQEEDELNSKFIKVFRILLFEMTRLKVNEVSISNQNRDETFVEADVFECWVFFTQNNELFQFQLTVSHSKHNFCFEGLSDKEHTLLKNRAMEEKEEQLNRKWWRKLLLRIKS